MKERVAKSYMKELLQILIVVINSDLFCSILVLSRVIIAQYSRKTVKRKMGEAWAMMLSL